MWADETKLKQVVVNLLTNAVKFTPVGRVGAGARVRCAGDEVVVTVRDTGVGIAEDDQARIFEAFQRGDRRRSVEGTGLGLTLSKRFVELHGGRIWVESAVGAGSSSASRSRSGRRGEGPGRRGQRAQPEARPRRARARGLCDVVGARRRARRRWGWRPRWTWC